MGSEVLEGKKNPKNVPLNPNWAQLQQCFAGKRKERDYNDSESNILTPTSFDFSVTDEIAMVMDCEMVGLVPSEVLEGKKNPKNVPLNPNWAQLQQKLKVQGSKPKLPNSSNGTSSPTVLGKRKERDSNDSESNILAPTSSDFSVTDEIAMDCEMVGVSPQGNKSALGRVTLVNRWGNVIYDEFVRPVDRVVDFRTEISGIRPRDLRKAKDFPAVQKKVAELIKGKILVGHALRNDLKALLLSHSKKDTRDTSEYQPFLKESRKKALRHLAVEFLGVQIQNGEHCPIEDARAAMLLYQRHKKEWERSVKDRSRLIEKQKNRKKRKKSNNMAAKVK